MKKILFGIAGVILLVVLYFLFVPYSEGFRGGTVAKLSKRGFVFKTYEGQLNSGGLSEDNTGSPAAPVWTFSVGSGEDQVIKALEDALLNGHRVRLFYKERYIKFPWQGDTKYYIYKVEQLKTGTSVPAESSL